MRSSSRPFQTVREHNSRWYAVRGSTATQPAGAPSTWATSPVVAAPGRPGPAGSSSRAPRCATELRLQPLVSVYRNGSAAMASSASPEVR